MPHLLNIKAKILIFVTLLLAFNLATANNAADLYYVEIRVIDETANTRWAAFKQGMDEVFVRISGDSGVMGKLKRPAPTTYVKQYSYVPLPEPVINADGKQLTHKIKIKYNGSLMEKYLLGNGFPVWSEHRPDTVIWLAVRDGQNEYVLKNTDQSLLKTTADKALTRRGIPVRWPLYDYKDKKQLSVADIRGGFKDPVTAASKRYTRGPALTGGLLWNGSQWQSSWSLLMDNSYHHWSLEDADYKQLINKAIDQAANHLGLVFAVKNSVNKQQLDTIQLVIQAVNSIEKYRYIENYLTGLSAVDRVTPLKVNGQNAVFAVTLRSNEEDFLNLIKNDAELIKVEVVEPVNDAPAIPEDNAFEIQHINTAPESGQGLDSVIEPDLPSESQSGQVSNVPAADNDGQAKASQQSQLPVYHYKLKN